MSLKHNMKVYGLNKFIYKGNYLTPFGNKVFKYFMLINITIAKITVEQIINCLNILIESHFLLDSMMNIFSLYLFSIILKNRKK